MYVNVFLCFNATATYKTVPVNRGFTLQLQKFPLPVESLAVYGTCPVRLPEIARCNSKEIPYNIKFWQYKTNLPLESRLLLDFIPNDKHFPHMKQCNTAEMD